MICRSDLSSTEYDPYFEHYLNLVPDDLDLLKVLQWSLKSSINFIRELDTDLDYSYKAGKWTARQVILHNMGTERVFTYRALCFLRGDKTDLPGFDQDIFNNATVDYAFAKAELMEQLTSTRNATLSLFKYCNPTQLNNLGTASGKTMSARVIPFLIAGHYIHHEQVLKSRY